MRRAISVILFPTLFPSLLWASQKSLMCTYAKSIFVYRSVAHINFSDYFFYEWFLISVFAFPSFFIYFVYIYVKINKKMTEIIISVIFSFWVREVKKMSDSVAHFFPSFFEMTEKMTEKMTEIALRIHSDDDVLILYIYLIRLSHIFDIYLS